MCKVLVHPPLTRILPTRIVIIDDNRFMADIIQNPSGDIPSSSPPPPPLTLSFSFLNVCSRSSPIMILENRIRLIEIQLRCQTPTSRFTPPSSIRRRAGRTERERGRANEFRRDFIRGVTTTAAGIIPQ